MKKNIIIIGHNSKENTKWLREMQNLYSNNYNVKVLKYNSLVFEKANVDEELLKLEEITKKLDEYIIIAKSLGIIIALLGIEKKIISPKLLIGLGFSLKHIDRKKLYNTKFIQSIKNINKRIKIFIIQQENDNQESYEEIKKILPQSIPIISTKGKNHNYNCNKRIKKLIDIIIKLNSINIDAVDVEANDISDAIIKIDKNRSIYKFYNNWLSDPDNKILIFYYNGEKYIAKRIKSGKSSLEINNSKILKDIIFKINNTTKYNFHIETPSYYRVNNKYGYLVSKYYGEDLNQLYYNKTYKYDDDLKKVITLIYDELCKNKIRYNGFLPRNIIVKDNNIYFIDFEDINKKSFIATETNLKIAWSYFFDIDYNLKSKITFEDDFSKYFLTNKIIKKYKNPYNVAVIAESSYNNSFYRVDDCINVLSRYLTFEIEIFLDIIIYETKLMKDSLIIEFIYSLAQRIRILEIINKEYVVKNMIKDELKEFFISLKNKESDINYIRKIIKMLEKM